MHKSLAWHQVSAAPCFLQKKRAFAQIKLKMKRFISILTLTAVTLGCSRPGPWSDKSNWYVSTRESNAEYPDVFYLVSTNIRWMPSIWTKTVTTVFPTRSRMRYTMLFITIWSICAEENP